MRQRRAGNEASVQQRYLLTSKCVDVRLDWLGCVCVWGGDCIKPKPKKLLTGDCTNCFFFSWFFFLPPAAHAEKSQSFVFFDDGKLC